MKEYADHRRNTQESTMKIGDNVIILQKGLRTSSTQTVGVSDQTDKEKTSWARL